ncbi:kinase-like domain-containing protein [Thelephora terrestris]|uniref:Kinase-like domain-containing protein n=1 Tax=Thelephora terrestris TaxID=56493 RepID=A0A9P6HNC9_9AGAM|nr:kinase-like domain-containing protein [Thelephora terrestris]
MVSERMVHGDIVEYTRSHPEVNRVQLLVDAAIGLEYLHDHNMVHGDLRGANIFINKHLCACLSDFGFSTGLGGGDSDSISSGSTGSLVSSSWNFQWASPELLLFNPYGPTKQSDCYALGMVIYEVLCGEVPYQGKDLRGVKDIIASGRRPPKPEAAESLGFIGGLWNMVKATWQEDPASRPDVKEILRCLRSTALAWDTRLPAPLGCR